MPGGTCGQRAFWWKWPSTYEEANTMWMQIASRMATFLQKSLETLKVSEAHRAIWYTSGTLEPNPSDHVWLHHASIPRLIDAWMCLAAYVRFNAPQQCIRYQAKVCFLMQLRLSKVLSLSPWKQWHMQLGGTRKTVYLCANCLHLSVLMNRIWSGRLVNQQILMLFVKNSDCFNGQANATVPYWQSPCVTRNSLA